MKSKLLAAVAAIAVMAAAGAARADSTTDAEVTALKAQAAALKKQNQALENRLNKLEKKQESTAQKQDATDKQLAQQAAKPAPDQFVAADLLTTKGAAAIITDEGPICWHGVCIFGTIDGGLSYATHGLPINDHLYLGNEMLTNKYARNAYFGFNPSGMSYSVLGAKGAVEILPGISGVFWASTNINPQSGQLANAAGSFVDNNGLNFRNYSLFGDGSRGGQPFNDQLYVGLSSPVFGQLQFGRNRTLATDFVGAYDPTGGASAFSLIGYAGTYVSGEGFTEEGRWDNSLKYKVEYTGAGISGRFGAVYKFVDGNGGSNIGPSGLTCTGAGTPAPNCVANSAAATVPHFLASNNDAGEIGLGFSYAGFDVDGVIGYYHQAINITGPLSSAQYGGIDQFTSSTGLVTTSYGNANANTVAAQAADLGSGQLGVKYTWNQWKFYGGWSHNVYHNPHDQVGVGADSSQGAYMISSIANNSFPHARLMDTEWVGFKYAWDPKTDIFAVYERVEQNTFGTFQGDGVKTAAACNVARVNTVTGAAIRSAACSGHIDQGSTFVDYHFTKRFDVYGGINLMALNGGFAAGYFNTSLFAPTVGARFTF